MRIRLRVQQPDLREDRVAVQRGIRRWVPRAGVYVRETMRSIIAQRTQTVGRTGFLRNSITLEVQATGFQVYATADYAVFVDKPTRPHEIRPVRKKALAFARAGGIVSRTQGGQVRTRFLYGGRETKTGAVIVQVVRHPGTRGVGFEAATAKEVARPLAAMLQESVQESVRASRST